MATSADEAIMDRRMRRTRRSIRDALQALLQNKTIDQITIKDIAAKADIGYTTFFRHFPTKEAALADLADNEAAELLSFSFPLLEAEDSRASCVALCRYVDEKRTVWSALLTSGAASFVREALAVHTQERSEDWPAARTWLPDGVGTALITGLTVEVLTWWLTHAPQFPSEQVAEIMDRLFVAQLVASAD